MMSATKLYASWEAAEKLGTTRKTLWYYQSKGYIEGTTGDDGFLYYTEEQIAHAKLPATSLRHIAEKKALRRLQTEGLVESAVPLHRSAPRRALQELQTRESARLSAEHEDIQRWAMLPWREY